MPKFIRRNSSGYSSDITDWRSKESSPPVISETFDQLPLPKPRNHRLMSIENSNLTEVITIYERLQRGQEEPLTRETTKEIRRMSVLPTIEPILETSSLDHLEEASISSEPESDVKDVKFSLSHPAKYIYFSESTNLLIADKINRLSPNFESLLQRKNYWLNISDPSDEDFQILFYSYGVHDLTIADITIYTTEEKVEAYSHYTFFSLCLNYVDDEPDYSVVNRDIDNLFTSQNAPSCKKNFYILLFKDFVLTLHKGLATNCLDILDFQSLLLKNFSDTFNPEWVFFSIFLQISQKVKGTINTVEPEVNKIRVGQSDTPELHYLMRENMFLEIELYFLQRFLKPKIHILRQLKSKCSKRISQTVLRLLDEIMEDFKEVKQDLNHFNQILERSQDTFLALVTSEQTKEANELNKMMKRISEIALTFVPLTVVGSFFGMNVTIPYQTDNYPNVRFFYVLVGLSIAISIFLYVIRNRVLI